jgi:hypothetical protein
LDRFRSAGEFDRALEKALPEEAVRTLNGAGAEDAVPRSAQPTMVMEETPAPVRANLPTEVMESALENSSSGPLPEAQGIPEPAGNAAAPEPGPGPAVKTPPPEPKIAEKPRQESTRPAAGLAARLKPAAESAEAWLRGFLATCRGRIAAAVAAVRIVLAAGWWILSGGTAALTCGSVESCIA